MVMHNLTLYLDAMSSHQFSCALVPVEGLNALTPSTLTSTGRFPLLLYQLPILWGERSSLGK